MESKLSALKVLLIFQPVYPNFQWHASFVKLLLETNKKYFNQNYLPSFICISCKFKIILKDTLSSGLPGQHSPWIVLVQQDLGFSPEHVGLICTPLGCVTVWPGHSRLQILRLLLGGWTAARASGTWRCWRGPRACSWWTARRCIWKWLLCIMMVAKLFCCSLWLGTIHKGGCFKDPCLFSPTFISQSYYVIVGLIMSIWVPNIDSVVSIEFSPFYLNANS